MVAEYFLHQISPFQCDYLIGCGIPVYSCFAGDLIKRKGTFLETLKNKPLEYFMSSLTFSCHNFIFFYLYLKLSVLLVYYIYYSNNILLLYYEHSSINIG